MSKDRGLTHNEAIVIDGRNFEFVKERLAGGGVYRSDDHSLYLRIGGVQETAEEHIYIQALRNRGFPVSEVVGSGRVNDQYYFIEKSLGEKPFGIIFGEEYASTRFIKDRTFEGYLDIMQRFTDASFNPANHRHAIPDLFELSLASYTSRQYDIDKERLISLIAKAQSRIAYLPSVDVHEDLGPFNVMPGGVID